MHAISRITGVEYGEIVATIASKSAGPGTRQNIDEFTRTTSRAVEVLGGAVRGKAIIILNPAEPPLMMRDTVFVLSEVADQAEVEASIEEMAAADATVPEGLGTFGYDDDGVPAQRFALVRDVIFCGYLASRETAPLIG